MKRVLVFDSGVGGLSVLDAIAAVGVPVVMDYAADNAWLPYGDKSDGAVRARVPTLLLSLVDRLAPDLIVLACNTASTIALEAVREAVALPIVGVVPPIKPAAAATRSGVIGLLATPATVMRAYTDDLIARFAANVRVVRFGSTALVEAAEAKLAGRAVDGAAITDAIAGLFCVAAEIDVVALACTHFPLLQEELAAAAPRQTLWLSSGAAIARRAAELLHLKLGGCARCERVLLTGAVIAERAFRARGFHEIASAPVT